MSRLTSPLQLALASANNAELQVMDNCTRLSMRPDLIVLWTKCSLDQLVLNLLASFIYTLTDDEAAKY
jgi:hypothetical protein